MPVDDIAGCDFAFRAVDEDDQMCRYEALFTFKEAASDTTYVVYADLNPADDGSVGTYASVLSEPEQALRAQQVVDSGGTPKKPPVLDLLPIEDQSGWDLVEEAFELVEAEED